MSAPLSLGTAPNINQQTNGLYCDNGAFITDGAGNVTSTGTATQKVAGPVQITTNNKFVTGMRVDGVTASPMIGIDASDNTKVQTPVGKNVTIWDGTTTFATIAAALTKIGTTALQLSDSPTIPAPTGAAQTIATNTGIISRTAPAGACTGAIMQPGTVDGQICIVTNENVASTTNIITFSATIATANVINDGTNPQVIKCGTAKAFVWLASLNAAAGAWVALAPFAG